MCLAKQTKTNKEDGHVDTGLMRVRRKEPTRSSCCPCALMEESVDSHSHVEVWMSKREKNFSKPHTLLLFFFLSSSLLPSWTSTYKHTHTHPDPPTTTQTRH
jgi:hypothetical protein